MAVEIYNVENAGYKRVKDFIKKALPFFSAF